MPVIFIACVQKKQPRKSSGAACAEVIPHIVCLVYDKLLDLSKKLVCVVSVSHELYSV